jgi:PAS domain S-box-containing protein
MKLFKLTKKSISTNEGIFSLMIMAIFVTELVVTGFLTNLFSRLGLFYSSLLDAAILMLLFSLPLWYFVVQPLSGYNASLKKSPRNYPEVLFVAVLTGIFLTEFLVMLTLPTILPLADKQTLNLADACFTTLLNTPPLWWLTCSRQIRRKQSRADDLLGAPIRLYALLLFMVFLTDLLMDILYPFFFPYLSHTAYIVTDSSLSTLFIAPLLWWFVVRPLMKSSQSSRARANAIYSQAVEAIVTIDAEGAIESFNPAAERIFGYNAEEMVGKEVQLLFAGGRQSLENILRMASESSRNAKDAVVTIEISGRRRDGSIVDIDVSASRLLLEGRQEYLMIMRDISERKRLENELKESAVRFRQVFEQSEDAILFIKPGTCSVIDANVTAEKLFGYSKSELQETGLQLFTGHEAYSLLANAINNISPDRSAFLDRIANTRKDGEEIIVSMRAKLMTLQGVTLVYCTFRNITDRLHMEREAREIQSKLIQTNKMTSLGLLVSGVAHEINNPNNFIMANSRLLERSWADALNILREYHRENGEFFIGGVPFSELDAHSPNLFAGIIDGARRIESIVNNLKGFARNDSSIESSGINVNQVASAAISILHYELNKFTDNFHAELAEGIPVIKGSSQQLGQVIINLLMNACQSLPDRRSGIWLSTGFDTGKQQVTISVRDEGHGMSPEKSSMIMEPFFTTKLDSGGTGLGLSICQSIVKDHSWSMDFTSEQGKGSTFVVRIPLPATA